MIDYLLWLMHRKGVKRKKIYNAYESCSNKEKRKEIHAIYCSFRQAK